METEAEEIIFIGKTFYPSVHNVDQKQSEIEEIRRQIRARMLVALTHIVHSTYRRYYIFVCINPSLLFYSLFKLKHLIISSSPYITLLYIEVLYLVEQSPLS